MSTGSKMSLRTTDSHKNCIYIYIVYIYIYMRVCVYVRGTLFALNNRQVNLTNVAFSIVPFAETSSHIYLHCIRYMEIKYYAKESEKIHLTR